MRSVPGLAALLLAVLFFGATVRLTLREAEPDCTVSAGTPSPAPAPSAAPAAPEASPAAAWTVYIPLNTASEEELTLLPGIGEALAAAIVRHREEYGPFRKLEDLMDVPGIGESVLDALYAQMEKYPLYQSP